MKCPNCGLRNFANRKQCKRCKSDLSPPLKQAKNDKQKSVDSVVVKRAGFRFAWIFAGLAVVPLGGLFFSLRPGLQETPVVTSEAAVAQAPVTPAGEQPGKDTAEQNSQSEAAARQLMTDLKRFQAATERGLAYDEYDKQLNSLKTGLNDTLPSFVGHQPSDETFREELAAAVRDYTAAGNWWKTTITNATVFTEADRNERTEKNWDSARTHLTNAEKALVP